MPTLSFNTVDVFTVERYTGNPLAIVNVPVGHGVTDEQMQTVAREFNLSETVFIRERSSSSSDIPEWRLRIFMTQAEVPFAGHPTIGSACYALGTLANGARKGRLLCNAGPIEVEFENGVARASIPHNFHWHVENKARTEDVYALQPELKHGGASIEAVDVVSPVQGMNFIIVHLRSLEDLGRIKVTGVKPKAQLDKEWDFGLCWSYFYVVTPSPDGEVVTVRTRMVEATMEDPATGSAACALSCFLAMKMGTGKKVPFEIVQGVEMGRRSEIGVEVTLTEGGDGVERVVLSGSAVGVMDGRVEV